MGTLSDSAEDAALNYLRSTYTWFLAAFTTQPDDAGSGGVEVSGGSYARVAVTWSAVSGGSMSNSSTVQLPQATASWGTVVAIGYYSASSGGTFLGSDDITPQAVTAPQQPQWTAGQLVVSIA
jgi:hypothetical protein